MVEKLQMRVQGDSSLPTLVYLPGIHGDWTLVGGFKKALEGRVRFVEFTYPRTLEWSIEEYALSVESALLEQGIREGWVVGESFSSQVGWALVGRNRRVSDTSGFSTLGYVVANGFGRYPLMAGVHLVRWLFKATPLWAAALLMRGYRWYAACGLRGEARDRGHMEEFFARRNRLDCEAIRHRLWLIASWDPSQVIQECHVPVYYLAGFLDPIVPWYFERRYLSRYCPGYRGSHTVYRADHCVLSTGAQASAKTILHWMESERGSDQLPRSASRADLLCDP